MVSNLPLSSLTLKPPPDGLPCIGDFTTTCISYLFSGSRLHREPLDVNFSEVMKLAARFEQMISERRRLEEYKDVNDEELLSSLISRYNSYKANAALKRWQVNGDQQSAILGIITGMCSEARALVRQHLDFNKYEESGYLTEQLKAAEYQVVVTNLSHDFKEAVLHMRDQISVGMEVVNSFMTKRAMMIVGDKNQGSLPALQRRIITDATNRFGAPTEIGKMHHIGFLDFSKFGRLTMIDINAAVVLDLMTELKDSVYLGLHSQCHCPTIYEFALTSVKDKIDVQHESYSVFRPTQVQVKSLKQTNAAGHIGYKALSASQYLTLAVPENIARPLRRGKSSTDVTRCLFPESPTSSGQPYEYFDKGWTALDDMALQRDLSQKLDVEDSQFDGPDFTPEDKRTPLHPALEETKANFDAPSIIPETSPHKVVSKFVFDPNQLKERQANSGTIDTGAKPDEHGQVDVEVLRGENDVESDNSKKSKDGSKDEKSNKTKKAKSEASKPSKPPSVMHTARWDFVS
ncbi:Uncharacterized protein SCF082_LOCUS38149 [Durusdinium trenchii]|uniref:Uncharacterized protein n=1 Tax=Durusdinium trenchii TaxID=1381693 RepID=A0ABP0PX42_9DINO